MLDITDKIQIPDAEIKLTAIRAQGPGGQNVNKVSSAIHLRFDIPNSASLPEVLKERLLHMRDYRITADGIIVIKAQRYRTREQNLDDAKNRLKLIISSALVEKKKRKKTRPTLAAKQKRLEQKNRRAGVKKLRSRIAHDD